MPNPSDRKLYMLVSAVAAADIGGLIGGLIAGIAGESGFTLLVGIGAGTVVTPAIALGALWSYYRYCDFDIEQPQDDEAERVDTCCGCWTGLFAKRPEVKLATDLDSSAHLVPTISGQPNTLISPRRTV